MVKNLFKILMASAVCFSLLAFPASVRGAQASTVHLLSDSYQAPNQNNQDMITFELLGQQELTLTGPYDAFNVLFGLPADWELIEGGEIQLSMGISFNSNQISTEIPAVSGGLMTVRLNSITVGILSLSQTGEQVFRLTIPTAALKSPRSDGRMELSLQLDAGFSCDFDQQMIVIVHPTSYLILPHQSVVPETNLVNFPSPIFQNSVFRDSALIIVPNEPSEAELQTVLTVSAGLGSVSNNRILLNLVTVNEITPEQLANNHLILIGTAASLPLAGDIQLSLSRNSNGFEIPGGSQDDGVIELVGSPWSAAHVVLVLTGNTELGLVKAGQALSTGVLRPNRLPNLAIIDSVQSRPVPTSQPVDQTLGDLGYETELIEGRGLNILSYEFYIPPGLSVTEEAYFEMIFANSALLNFDRSGLIVLLNGVPIGSAQLNEVTASNNKNSVRVNLPSSEVIPGNNTIDIEADLLPLDNCSTPNLQGLWVTIWSESNLHIPLVESTVDPTSTFDLAEFPSPFIYDLALGNTAFVLPRNGLTAWRAAVRLASYLGDQVNPPVVTMRLFYADSLPENERPNFNFLMVGRATQLDVINEINDSLPAPFASGSDIALESSMQVIFRLPPETPLGYLELLTSPWNSEHVILTALGNTDEGVTWAGSALIDSPMRSQIAGNFSVINDQQVIATDTRLPSLVDQPVVSDGDTVMMLPEIPAPQSSPSTYQRPGWILVALGISTALAILVIVIVIFTSWRRNRTKRPKNDSV